MTLLQIYFNKAFRFRYESPIGASPSRNLDHQKPFYDEEFDRSTSYRGSVGRALGSAPSYNGKNKIINISRFYFLLFYVFFFVFIIIYLAIHSYRSPPKPGYGFKQHSTLPPSYRSGYVSGYSSVSV